MKHERKWIVGFFVRLSLVVVGVLAVSLEVGNSSQRGQDISVVQIWSNGISCSGTKIPPYHALTAAHRYNSSSGGAVIAPDSGMHIWDPSSAELYHSGGNIVSWSLYPDRKDLTLVTTKAPFSGAVTFAILHELLPDSDMTGQGVSLCGQRLVDNSRDPADGDGYNASCSVTDERVTLNSTHTNTRWSNGPILIYYSDPDGGVFLDGSLVGVISKSAGVAWEEARHNGKLVKVTREQYSPQPLVTRDVYNWPAAHGAQVTLVATPQQPQQPKPQDIQVGKPHIGEVNRVDTSLLLLDKAVNKPEMVLVTGHNFPDGLVAGALVNTSKSGVALTMGTNATEPETLNKLRFVGTSKAIIVGGIGAVSQDMEDSLKAAGIQVERIARTDRYDTAFQVFGYMKASGKLKLDAQGEPYMPVVTGRDFPDALAASTVAAKVGAVAVLTDTPEQMNRVVTGAWPYAVGAQIDKLMANMGVSMSGRSDGEDRYDTANKLVDWPVWRGGDTVMVTVGTSYSDVSAAGGLAAPAGQLFVLANPPSAVLKVPASVKNPAFINGEGTNPDKHTVAN